MIAEYMRVCSTRLNQNGRHEKLRKALTSSERREGSRTVALQTGTRFDMKKLFNKIGHLALHSNLLASIHSLLVST